MHEEGKVLRLMHPTASFTLSVELIAWIAAEAERRNCSKSALMRAIVTKEKDAQEAEAA